MKTTIHKEVFINAPREKVWHTMLDDATYRQWAAAFTPGTYYKGSWEEGAKMLFLGPHPETGEEGGMVSLIKACRPHEFVSIEHQGFVSGGVEDTESEAVGDWKGLMENYTFTETDGGTTLTVDTDMVEEMAAEMADLWDEALRILKELAEG
jgi:uncharacterized protein YndB with AHSA1/START domain